MQVQQELKRFRNDALYFQQHRRELLARYPDRWVAVYNRQVVGNAADPRRLLSQLKREGIPPSQVYWEHLSTKEELLIVPSGAP